MKRYFRIYTLLLRLSWSALLSYRASFINGLITNAIWSTFHVFLILFLTAKTSSVFGWTRNELIILMASSNILLGIFYFFCTINFHEFADTIHLGKLDTILLKPIDSQFFLSFFQASYYSLIRTVIGMCVVVFILSSMHAHITVINVIAFSLFLVFGIILQYALWYSIITLTMWFTTLSNLLDLLYNTNDLARFPKEMYQGGRDIIYFLVFPYTLIVLVPVKTLLQKVAITDVIALIVVASILLFFSRAFWKFALRFYTSAGG